MSLREGNASIGGAKMFRYYLVATSHTLASWRLWLKCVGRTQSTVMGTAGSQLSRCDCEEEAAKEQ